ncbi:hypothetical protein Tco_0308429 [Tanacetum coccineum]
MIDLIYIPGVDSHQLRMIVFPLSLADDAQQWWINEGEGKITVWEELVEKFFCKSYPESYDGEEEMLDEGDNWGIDPLEFISRINSSFDKHIKIDGRTKKEDEQSQIKRKYSNTFEFIDEKPNKRMCKVEKFEAIQYSLGPNEEYIAIRKCEYDIWDRNEDNMSKIYQDIFQKKDNGWKDPVKEISTNIGREFTNMEILKCWSLETSRRLFNTQSCSINLHGESTEQICYTGKRALKCNLTGHVYRAKAQVIPSPARRNETLGLLAQKDIDIQEGLKVKAYEISVVQAKHNELVKQSLLTRSHYEGLVKEKTKAQHEIPRLYAIPYDQSDPANRLVPDREEILTLADESRSKLNKDFVKPFDYTSVSKEDKMYGISHPYQKLKGFYKGVLNLGPYYIRDVKMEEWLTRGHVSVHEMEW